MRRRTFDRPSGHKFPPSTAKCYGRSQAARCCWMVDAKARCSYL